MIARLFFELMLRRLFPYGIFSRGGAVGAAIILFHAKAQSRRQNRDVFIFFWWWYLLLILLKSFLFQLIELH